MYTIEQRGPNVFVVVHTTNTKRVVHWTNTMRRAKRVKRQVEAASRNK